jgi:hypothetical protein
MKRRSTEARAVLEAKYSGSYTLELLWKGMGYADGDFDPKKPEGEVAPKPQIYRATWMRKPGDPDYEEDEGETAGGPVMNGPEPSPNPAAGSQSQPVRVGEPSNLRPAAGFGRFQGS